MERPRFTGKKLSSLDIKEVPIFCDSVRNFEAGIPRASPSARCSRIPKRSNFEGRWTVDPCQFFQYPLEILLKELQKAVRPLS
jgi:hypothetical protein